MRARQGSAGAALGLESPDSHTNPSQPSRKAPRQSRQSAGGHLGRDELDSASEASDGGELRNDARNAVVLGKDDAGRPSLVIAYGRRGDPDFDVSFLLDLPNVGMVLAEGVRLWTLTLAPRSRSMQRAPLRDGLVAYLRKLKQNCRWDELPGLIQDGFGTFLKAKLGDPDKPLSASTVDDRISAASRIFAALAGLEQYRYIALNCRAALPAYFVGRDNDSVPRQALSAEQLEKIWSAVSTELIELGARFHEGEQRVLRGRALLAEGQPDYSDFDVTLAALAARYFLMPEYATLEADWKEIYYFVHPHGRLAPGVMRFAQYLYASPRDLIPFMLLLSIEMFGNAESIVRLKWSEIQKLSVAGTAQFLFTLDKKRAVADPEKVVGGWVEPVLDLLAKITQRPRSTVPPEHQDHIFIFATNWGKTRRGKCFFRFHDNQQDAESLRTYLDQFCERHDLPRFTLSQLRPTGLDQVGAIHGSLAAFLTAWHTQFTTTDGSYLQGSAKRAEQESLGHSQQRLARFVSSGGKIDTRRSARTPYMDKQAATPGFTCADPFDSPRPGQRKGKLCDEYGGCPDCAHAAYNLESPMAVAMYRALRLALVDSQQELSPRAWLDRCKPRIDVLDEMLGRVDKAVESVSLKFEIRLPPIA
jgi:hypothetical protein